MSATSSNHAYAFECADLGVGAPSPATSDAGATDHLKPTNTACGQKANAGTPGGTGTTEATAVGANSQGTGTGSVAIGGGSVPVGNLTFPTGNAANATGLGSTAIGGATSTTTRGAFAIDNNTTAVGSGSTAGNGTATGGTGASAFGVGATASGTNSFAAGFNSFASGPGDIAIGEGNQVLSDNSTSTGDDSIIKAGSAHSSLYGSQAVIGPNSPNSMALGANTAVGPNAPGAVAIGTDSTGHGAVATLPNQIVAGTANQTITAPGITSSLSRSRQSGPLEVVTSDANGNLATDGGDIFRRLDKNQEGVALALAAVNPDLTGNERFGMTANWGNFDGANAFGMGFEGVLGHDWIMRGDRWAVTGGWGVGFAQGNGDDVFGGRIGAQWTWGGAPTTVAYASYALPPIK